LVRPRNVLISTTAAVAALGGGAALAWNTSEPDQHRADGKAAAVALRHPASGVERRGGDTNECELPAPRTELERALQRKLLREMAKHPPYFPKGWIVGQCNYGSASVP
jgi:hypothetical protein